MRMRWGMGMNANSVMDLYNQFGNLPLDMIKAGETVLVYCKKCKKELDLDRVIEHMTVNDQFPDGHSVHFTIEKG